MPVVEVIGVDLRLNMGHSEAKRRIKSDKFGFWKLGG